MIYVIATAFLYFLHNAYLVGYYCSEKDRKGEVKTVWELTILLIFATLIDLSMRAYKYFKQKQ